MENGSLCINSMRLAIPFLDRDVRLVMVILRESCCLVRRALLFPFQLTISVFAEGYHNDNANKRLC
jgi:hypothetical protein